MRKNGALSLSLWSEMQNDEIARWVVSTLKTKKISYASASRQLGLPLDAISKVVRGDRDLSASEMAQIAEMADADVPKRALETGLQPRYIRAVGEVAAGLWRDVDNEEFEQFDFVALVDARWPVGSVFGFVVKGESINKKASDGDRVVALMLDYAPRQFQTGDWVIVERVRHDLRERTVKQVMWGGDNGWELWPRSDDPRYQEPLLLGEHDNEAIHVVAFVLDFVSNGTRF